jgi:hypothetical protein
MKNSISNNSKFSTSTNPSDIGEITLTTSQQLLNEMITLVLYRFTLKMRIPTPNL